jgi:multicomponent Na+:H+ antiporter subunit F
MLLATLFAILVVMLLALLRAFAGPTLYDRILAVNLFGTKTVLFVAVLGYVSGKAYFLDIAMIYALLNFISIVGIFRYFEQKQANTESKDGPW